MGQASPPLAITLVALSAATYLYRWAGTLFCLPRVPSPGGRQILKITFAGLFFSQVLLTVVGGAAVRGWPDESSA
jgi:hypothetical protein